MKKIKNTAVFCLILSLLAAFLPASAEQRPDISDRVLLKLDFNDTLTPSVGQIQGQSGSFTFTEGKNGKAAKFTGGNYIDLGTIDFSQSKTIGGWFRINRFNNVGDPVIFGNKSWFDTKKNGLILALVKPDQLKYNWGDNASGERKDIKYDYSYNDWMYVAIASDISSKTVKFYVNGALSQSVDFSAFAKDCLTGPNTFKLGNDGTGNYECNDDRYEFLADDFTIFDGALTQQEIAGVIEASSQLDGAWLALDAQRILGNNAALNEVTGDLVLPKEVNGIPVTWTSYHPAVDEGNGFVTRGTRDVNAELTATLNNNGATRDKTFRICVKGMSIPGETVYESEMRYASEDAFFSDDFVFEAAEEGVDVNSHGALVFEETGLFLKRKTYGTASAAGLRIKKDVSIPESTDPYQVEFTIEQVNGSPIYLEGVSASRGWQPMFTMALENDALTVNANASYGSVKGVANRKVTIRVAINGVDKNMDIYVDGSPAFTKVPFRNSSATMVESLRFLSKSGIDSTQDGGIRFYYMALKKMQADGFDDILSKADIHTVTGENTNRITKDLTFSNTEGITWRSSDQSVIADDGTVIRGAQDQTVTLYADIDIKGQTVSIPYTVTVRNESNTAPKVFQIVNETQMPVLNFQKNQRLRIERDGYGENFAPVLTLYRDGQLEQVTAEDGAWLTIPENTGGCLVKAMLIDLQTGEPGVQFKQLGKGPEEKTTIKLGVFSDLHVDMIPRGYDRLAYFMEQMQEKNADAIISLGDFADAKSANQPVIDLFRSTSIPAVSVLGNHDLDSASKAAQLAFTGEKRAYYSMDTGGVHCVFLDTNFIYQNGTYIDYNKGNQNSASEREYLSEEQLVWLKKDLSQTTKPCIFFSHESLAFAGNSQQVLEVIRESGVDVIAAVNGHNHVDGVTMAGDIPCIDVNSMSGQWMGSSVEPLSTDYYTAAEFSAYPYVKQTAPYTNPLFAVFTIDTEARTVSVEGQTGEFIGKTPKERGHWSIIHNIPYTASITDKNFTY